MKSLKIMIKDAGVFKNPNISKSQDKMMDVTGYVSRYDKRSKSITPYLKIPAGTLSVQHVANLLRVLFGQRPVPTIRKVNNAFVGDPYFVELAKKCRVKIDSVVFPADVAHKEGFYPEETTTVRKSIGDSWQTAAKPYFLDGTYVQVRGGLLYHDRLHRYLENELFCDFTNLVRQYGSFGTIQKALEVLNSHKTDTAVVNFCKKCKENGKTSLSNIILNEVARGIDINYRRKGRSILNVLMASGTIQTMEKFSAVVYVPVSDEDLEKVNKGTGIATFLEGGFAKVDGVEDWSDMIEFQTVPTVEGEKICS